MSNTNGAVADVSAEAAQSPVTPALTEGQWQAIVEAAAALQQAQTTYQQAQTQWRLVSVALGLSGEWEVNLEQRTIKKRATA